MISIANDRLFSGSVDYDFPNAALIIIVLAVNPQDYCEKEGE